ncbi:MAG: 30S ribosomal protein S17 [candidate division WOR-3 bacterium]
MMRKTKVGVVVSDKMQKTVVVEFQRFVQHPLYKKYIRKTTRVYAHDENNECKVGDKVLIEETRPLSKLKRWRVLRKLS